LKQWNKLSVEGRRQLVERPCDEPAEVESYKQYLIALVEEFTKSSVEFAPIDNSPPWADVAVVSERICLWARAIGVAPPTPEQWAALTPLQRFALFKLTQPGHSNENFIPAMREFSLLRAT
jgi:hypothetical protein